MNLSTQDTLQNQGPIPPSPNPPIYQFSFLVSCTSRNTRIHPSIELVASEDLPEHIGKIFVYLSALVVFWAPSDLSGTHSMWSECICSIDKWWGGLACCNCIFIKHNAECAGFWGLCVAQVEAFLKIIHECKSHPSALVSWFSTIGNMPCWDSGLWMVKRDLDRGKKVMSIIHLDSILHGVHLISFPGNSFVTNDMCSMDSLNTFKIFFVNKYIDYHTHEIAW